MAENRRPEQNDRYSFVFVMVGASNVNNFFQKQSMQRKKDTPPCDKNTHVKNETAK